MTDGKSCDAQWWHTRQTDPGVFIPNPGSMVLVGGTSRSPLSGSTGGRLSLGFLGSYIVLRADKVLTDPFSFERVRTATLRNELNGKEIVST